MNELVVRREKKPARRTGRAREKKIGREGARDGDGDGVGTMNGELWEICSGCWLLYLPDGPDFKGPRLYCIYVCARESGLYFGAMVYFLLWGAEDPFVARGDFVSRAAS